MFVKKLVNKNTTKKFHSIFKINIFVAISLIKLQPKKEELLKFLILLS